MRLFDVLGPVMIGPSSSHTAGAARIGYTAQKLLGEVPAKADIGLYGSFATTGKGHGTDRALVAGLLGLRPDDPRLPDSFALAAQRGMQFSIHPVAVIVAICTIYVLLGSVMEELSMILLTVPAAVLRDWRLGLACLVAAMGLLAACRIGLARAWRLPDATRTTRTTRTTPTRIFEGHRWI